MGTTDNREGSAGVLGVHEFLPKVHTGLLNSRLVKSQAKHEPVEPLKVRPRYSCSLLFSTTGADFLRRSQHVNEDRKMAIHAVIVRHRPLRLPLRLCVLSHPGSGALTSWAFACPCK